MRACIIVVTILNSAPALACTYKCRTAQIKRYFNQTHGECTGPGPTRAGLLTRKQLAQVAASLEAADPAEQEWCRRAICGQERPVSQDGQDLFLWHNYFAPLTLAGKRGFYVDSGANSARHLSNTYFFDKCLGWEGLCIEPLDKYHAGLRANRSCTLVPECISAEVNSTLAMQLESHGEAQGSLAVAATSHLRIRGPLVHIRCNPLHEMLRRAGRTSVDLWSLDVEGHEPQVLGAVQWARAPVTVLIAEAKGTRTAAINEVIRAGASGLAMEHQLLGDAVFADRSRAGALPAAKPAHFWVQPMEALLRHTIATDVI